MMSFYKFPEWSGTLRNLYWNIRACRNHNQKRTHYRAIARERDRLEQTGIDSEWIRKLGLYLTTSDHATGNRRLDALIQYETDLKTWKAAK